MDFSNPFAMMAQNFGQPQPMRQRQNTTPIDPNQFRQFAITLNDQALYNFAQMARQQGISEQDIQRGIQFIKSL